MISFTDRIADTILTEPDKIPHLTVVVPSERMITYLQRSLYTADNQPKISPRIITIDRWMQQLVEEPVIDKSRLLFRLYKIAGNNPVDINETGFDAFLAWGQLLLGDFDEIDRYLVDPKELFRNLKDIKELEHWMIDADKLSTGQQKFMAFWDKLGPYYEEFSTQLKKERQITKGKVYRQVAENINLVFQKDEKAHFVFAGFNALSLAEISIMKQLYKLGRARIIIDSDQYYLDDVHHEAGMFQRELIQELLVKELPFVENRLETKACEIDVIECSQSTGQAKVIGSILAEMKPEELNSTLLLLADEQQIVPMIQHLPKSVGKANITLGLPLRATSVRLWADLLFRVQESGLKRSSAYIYHKDAVQFLRHPFIQGVLTYEEQNKARELEKEIVEKNRLFLSPEKLVLSERLREVVNRVFGSWKNDWLEAVKTFRWLNIWLDERLPEVNLMEKAVLRSFDESLSAFVNLLEEEIPEMQIRTFKKLFSQHWSSETMSYFGNPLDGLQIMGLLETRGLDFKNILVLGLNEGTMPPTNPVQTLIPMDLRRFFRLPTPREKQGLFAHHFYRLIHSAEKITITFSSGQESLSSGEASRFIQQLELELAVKNPEFKIKRSYYALENEERIEEHIVEKSPEIINRLDEILKEGLSYSKLSAFAQCPLNFYYRYVLKIGEESKVEENVASNTLGTTIHGAFEELFGEFNKAKHANARGVNVDDIYKMIKAAPLVLEKMFLEHFSDDKAVYDVGLNHLTFTMAQEIVNKVLLREIEILKESQEGTLYINGLEEEILLETEFELNEKPRKVTIQGVLDRIDSLDGRNRVIDYKSGSVKPENVEVKKSNDSIVEAILKGAFDKKKSHALQLLMYSLLFHHKYGTYLDESGIVSFINVSGSPHKLEIKQEISKEEIPGLVLEAIHEMLIRMYDTGEPFIHDPKSDFCLYCGK